MEHLKECTKCHRKKSWNEYHKQKEGKNGLRSVCKKCTNIQSKISKAKNPNYKRNDRNRKKQKYHNDPACREIIKQRTRNYTKRKYFFAGQAVYQAVKSGKLPHISTQFCVKCGKPANQYHHPNGYNKENALNVEPMCFTCHDIEHS